MQYLILGWSEYKADLLQQRVVQPLQNFLTQQLQVSTDRTEGGAAEHKQSSCRNLPTVSSGLLVHLWPLCPTD